MIHQWLASEGVGGLAEICALSTGNEETENDSRLFDNDRDGFVIRKGVSSLIPKNLEFARHRCIPRYERDVEGRPDQSAQVQYINAHGTSRPHNDRLETVAVKRLLGKHVGKIAIRATKSMTENLLGGAGAWKPAFAC